MYLGIARQLTHKLEKVACEGILSTFLGILWSYMILAKLINFVKIV